jgi:2-dehydropantoate 2-reductase
MRFAVLGAGAIGAYVGAAIARGGHDVTLITRGPHLEAMRARGVQVLSPRGDFSAHPRATDDLASVSDADVVLVALKAYTLPELAPRLADLLKPGALTIWAQNGIPWWYFQSHPGDLNGTVLNSVDPGGAITRSIPPESVVGCVVYCSTEIVSPGVIRHVEGTRFVLGGPGGDADHGLSPISDALRGGGLKAPVDAQIRNQIWLKLVGNVAFNPITALTRATLGQLGSLPEMVYLLRALFEELSTVAEALGVTLPVSLERRLEAGIAVGDHKTSMLQDLEAGKPLEVDCLTGAVVEIAGILGLHVPHTHTVHACVKLLDELRRDTRPRS